MKTVKSAPEASILSNRALGIFCVVVTLVLVVLLPGLGTIKKFNFESVDSTSLRYLQEQLAHEPDNQELRLELAEKLFTVGDLEQSQQVVSALLSSEIYAEKAKMILFKVKLGKFYGTQETKERDLKKQQLISKINQLTYDLTDIQLLEILAESCYSLSEPALAAKVYQRITILLENSEISSYDVDFFELIGISSAQAESENNHVEQYAVKHLNALINANLIDEALIYAEKYLGQYEESKIINELAIKIAESSGKSTLARDWGRLMLSRFGFNEQIIEEHIRLEQAADEPKNSLQWLKSLDMKSQLMKHPELFDFASQMAVNLNDKTFYNQLSQLKLAESPKDPELLNKLVQDHLSLNDVKQALKYAYQQVNLQPDNVEARKQLVQVSNWNGAPHIAMMQSKSLFEQTGNDTYLINGINLGKQLFQYPRVAKYYQLLSTKRPLSDSEIKDLFEVLKETGYEDNGESQLKTYLNHWPKHRKAWVYLAKIYALDGQYNAAYTTLDQAEKKLGKSKNFTDKKINYALQAEQVNDAWKLLKQESNQRDAQDKNFWKFYTHVAWMLGYENDAIKGYEHLLSQNSIDKEGMERLIQMKTYSDDDHSLLELNMSAWKKFKKPDFLLDAIDGSIRLHKPKLADNLLEIADSHADLFKKEPRFWLLKAAKAYQEKNVELNKEYLLKVLAIDSKSINARTALIWSMIEHDSAENLRQFVNESIQYAGFNQSLSQAVAAAYQKLGDAKLAVKWYESLVNKNPDDYLLMLNYSTALTESGQIEKAKKINRYVVHKVRPNVVANLSLDEPNVLNFQQLYGQVVRDEMGAEFSEQWFDLLEKNQRNASKYIMEEYLVTRHLTSGQMNWARKYALKAMHKRVELPVWQQMMLAVENNNLKAIQNITASNSLDPINKIQALDILGQDSEALELVKHEMNDHQTSNTLYNLRQQASSLGINNPNGFAVSAKHSNLSELEFSEIHGEAVASNNNNSYIVDYQYLNLSSSEDNFIVHPDSKNEHNLAIQWQHRSLRNQYWIAGRAGLRQDYDLFGFGAGVTHQLWQNWNIHFEFQYNETSDESAAFRLMGARDSISAGIRGGLTSRDYFNINIHGRNYKARSGEHLGTGFSADFSTGYFLQFANPSISINAYGTLTEADLDDQIPNEILQILPENGTIDNVLADSYREGGFTLRIQDGEIRPFGFIEQSFHYYLNTGVFFTAPWSGAGFMAEGGVGMRLFKNDDLSIVGRYADSQGGVNAIATKSIELRYSYRFDGLIPH